MQKELFGIKPLWWKNVVKYKVLLYFCEKKIAINNHNKNCSI